MINIECGNGNPNNYSEEYATELQKSMEQNKQRIRRMDSLEEYVINHSSCGMPRCEYVENDIEIDCDECQKRMIEEHDAKVRADERKKAFKEFADLYREFCKAPNDETCLKEDIECEGMCIDCFEKWLQQRGRNEKTN